jgi:putative ABC transport system substrate-binding protein
MADPTSIDHATLAAGFDYYDLGLTTGDLVVRILSGAKPNEIPVTYVSESQVYLNLDEASRIGFEFPVPVIQEATAVYIGDTLFSR